MWVYMACSLDRWVSRQTNQGR